MTAVNASRDLEACAREPIHIIGSIQSHGLMFALSEPDFIVQQVGANISAFLGVAPQAVLGNSFEAVLGAEGFELFVSRLRSGQLSSACALRVALGAGRTEMHCVAHRHDGVLIVEFERVDGAHSLDSSEFAANIRILLSRMESAKTLLDYCDVAASEIQRVSGFDRVMVYRFDAEWNGEVVSESNGAPIREPFEGAPLAYLGLHFPAGDIPAQARHLFLSNAVRAIADLSAEPVELVPPIVPLTGRPLDMTHTFLRSPSGVHVEYLRNMGVRSSLAVSIIVDGRLWGMIACHHHAPRPIDWLTRSACELIARNLSLQITLRSSNELWQTQQSAQRLLDDYAGRLEAANARVDAASFADPLFLDLVDADGILAHIDGVVFRHGATVEAAALAPLLQAFRASAARGVASSDRLGEVDPSAASFAPEVSGAIFIELGKGGDDYLLLFRREFCKTVSWAGNPDKTVDVGPDGKLHPRTSFLAWQEVVRGRSRPWSDLELESARLLRERITAIRNLRRLEELEQLHAGVNGA